MATPSRTVSTLLNGDAFGRRVEFEPEGLGQARGGEHNVHAARLPPRGSLTAFSDSSFQAARALGRGAAGDVGQPLLRRHEVVVGEGLHHVFGGDAGAAHFVAGDGGAAFERESVRRLRGARARSG